MFWRMGELDHTLRGRLAEVSRRRGLAEGSFFRARPATGTLIGCLVTGLVAMLPGLLGFLTSLAEPSPPGMAISAAWLVLSGTWTIVLLIELLRSFASDVKPFLLVTPGVLIRADWAHGVLEGYRLSDAEDYKKVNTYNWRQQPSGCLYTFRFPGQVVSFKLKDPHELARLDALLATARHARSDVGRELVPESPGNGKPRSFTNPLGVFWVVTGVLLLVAFLILIAIAH